MKIKLIKIDVDQKQDSPLSNGQIQIHMINCHFHKDIKNVPVSTYFSSQFLNKDNTQDDVNKESKNLNISFRGRPLNGKRVQLPEDYSFALVSQDQKNELKNLKAKQLNVDAYYWNLDKIPSGTDSIVQVFDWLHLAQDIHSHVQLED